MALPQETITVRIEKHVKQLEGLAHTNRWEMANLLKGHIDEAVFIAQINNTWQRRVASALNLVCAPKSETPEVTEAEVFVPPPEVKNPNSAPLFDAVPDMQ
jgi:hypothetical protein